MQYLAVVIYPRGPFHIRWIWGSESTNSTDFCLLVWHMHFRAPIFWRAFWGIVLDDMVSSLLRFSIFLVPLMYRKNEGHDRNFALNVFSRNDTSLVIFFGSTQWRTSPGFRMNSVDYGLWFGDLDNRHLFEKAYRIAWEVAHVNIEVSLQWNIHYAISTGNERVVCGWPFNSIVKRLFDVATTNMGCCMKCLSTIWQATWPCPSFSSSTDRLVLVWGSSYEFPIIGVFVRFTIQLIMTTDWEYRGTNFFVGGKNTAYKAFYEIRTD